WWVVWLVTTNKTTGLSRAQRTHSRLCIHPCLPRRLRHTPLDLPLVCHKVLQTHPKCILGKSVRVLRVCIPPHQYSFSACQLLSRVVFPKVPPFHFPSFWPLFLSSFNSVSNFNFSVQTMVKRQPLSLS